MYSFEGQFRSRPTQSLGGTSTKEPRSVLLQRTQEHRQKREDQRKKNISAFQIQAFYRACKARQRQRDAERENFKVLFQSVQKGRLAQDDIQTLTLLNRQLIFFYQKDTDSEKLNWLCQLLVKCQDKFATFICSDDVTGLHQIKHLLWLSCRQLAMQAGSSSPLAAQMRMLEVFTASALYEKITSKLQAEHIIINILSFLIQKGYYKCMRVLVEEKIPSSLERTTAPPIPLAGFVLDLIKKPLLFVPKTKDNAFRDTVLRSMCLQLFCQRYSEQVYQFLLPALAYGHRDFPFVELLDAIMPLIQNHSVDDLVMQHTSKANRDLALSSNFTSPWLLYAVLCFAEHQIEELPVMDFQKYLSVLEKLVPQLQSLNSTSPLLGDESDSEEEVMEIDRNNDSISLQEVQRECLELLERPQHVRAVVSLASRDPSPTTLSSTCAICHALMLKNRMQVHKTRMLYTLACNPVFLRNLWHTCVSTCIKTVTGSQTPLLQMLSRGLQMTMNDINKIVPLLSVFCSLFGHLLLSLHDWEFHGEQTGPNPFMPFKLIELVPMGLALRDACLGIIELAHPDTRPTLKEDYRRAFQSVGVQQNILTADEVQTQRLTWAYLFTVMVHLLKQLYSRDIRRQYCPPNHWLARQVNIQADKPSQMYKAAGSVFVHRPFGTLSALNPDRMTIEEGPPLSTTEVRNLTILTEIPFVVSFQERVKIFHKLVQLDRAEVQGDARHFMGGQSINIMVRRNYLYEDAYDRLSPENEPNLKLRMQVQLKNFAGLDEAGIDGGGVFREFLSELLKTGFDPNRGFFKHTLDQLLYPNPQAKLLEENFTKHYHFLGRLLGKVIYENMLVELPFASFFVSKILSRHRGDVDIHHLASLDPVMYKNLLYLKDYEGDVTDLGLDFTVVNNDLGEAQVEDLKPNGKNIPVDSFNRIEYIHLMADYRLNRQIRVHCNAFREGLADVINIEWLRMFDHNELQVLISGAPIPIDLEDLKQNTNYSGNYTADHPVIQNFWSVVADFTDKQNRQLLRFVTSCSRPPLLGFKELYPAFCIHYAGSEERLPTASTCMNLLKLPEFKDKETMRQKLLYAIESGAGFELS